MYFTPDPSIRPGKDTVMQPVKPIYTFPEGGPGVQPCTFMPNQAEPAKCGGVR
jgi:hypothetical protein